MSADRNLFNRRALRRSLGTRNSRRSNTKSPARKRDRRGRVSYELRSSVRARLNQKIEEIKNGTETD